jgi:two-component system chemotaxis response regulator CheB
MAPGLNIKSAERGERLAAGKVYIAPPDFHLVIAPDHTLEFVDGRRIKFLRSSANPLLESAAQVLGNRVIAVVLTGGGSDATDGVQAVKSMGGVVIAQDPVQAQHPGMPLSAIQTGAVDYILPLDAIAPLLVRLASANVASPSE